ncbi:MAG: pirin family protein [Planctomycetota bacterium]|nr:pirin family protein [Planctomycetota bacterium]
MITVRPAEERGHANHGWLDSYHTFSFASYHDPRHMGFRTLRVINDDTVQPGKGFGTHSHQDMEIISYVLVGALEHQDSMGTGSVLRPGDVQAMSAGRGVTHSEFNHEKDETLHFLQIWIHPKEMGVDPRYSEKRFSDADKRNRLRLIVSPDGRNDSLPIHQDALVYASLLDPNESVTYPMSENRHAWLHIARGRVTVNGQVLATGDGAAVSNESELVIDANEPSEILLFDLS